MRHSTFELLACPECHGSMENYSVDPNADPCLTGNLYCKPCSTNFSILEGIPQFVQPDMVRSLNQRFSHVHDWFSLGYNPLSKLGFAYIGMDEQDARREITDRIMPNGGKVLAVSVGPGINLPPLVSRQDVEQVYGIDLSLRLLRRCQSTLQKKGWGVDLFLGSAERLPFRDNSFESIFQVGGINFFRHQKEALDEMIRVAKPGAQILIADETEKGALGYEKFMPGFKELFGNKREEITPPLALVPPGMQDVRVSEIWKEWLYCIEFRKP